MNHLIWKITLHVCYDEKNILKVFWIFFFLIKKNVYLLLYNTKIGDGWRCGRQSPPWVRSIPVIIRDATFF